VITEFIQFRPSEKDALRRRQAWSEFLGTVNFNIYATLTFSYAVTADYARREFGCWVNKINRRYYGSNWRKKPESGIVWAFVVEHVSKSYLAHVHAMIRAPGHELTAESAKWMEDLWRLRFGIADVGLIRSLEKAASYTVKTVPWGGEMFALSGIWDVWKNSEGQAIGATDAANNRDFATET